MNSSQPTLPVGNHLLTALLDEEYQHLAPHLERVRLSLGEIVYSNDQAIQDVYFPENSVISLLASLESGATTEVGLIGYEGMVGLGVFLGAAVTPDQAIVQLEGTALKMKASVLRTELRLGSPLQLLLLHYTRSFLTLMSQSVVCSQHHSLPKRLARWLLMMHDYSQSDTLKLTHEMVAAMIGTRRAGVSFATEALTKAGLIIQERGRIQIINREALEVTTCECYSIIREEFDRLLQEQIPKSKRDSATRGNG